MKRLLLLITALFLLFSVEGQILRYSNYTAPVPPEEDTTNYYSVYKAIYDEMTNPPGHDTAHFQSNMIYSLDTLDFVGGASVWDRMDLFYVFATKDETDALLNWVNTATFTITDPGSTAPTWTQYSGFEGDGSSDYLSTNYTPSSDATNMSQNSATLGAYCLEISNEDKTIAGANNTTGGLGFYMWPRSQDDHQMYAAINSDTRLINANSTAIGLNVSTRRGATETENYAHGASLGAGTASSSSLIAIPLYILARNQEGTADQFSSNEIAILFVMNGITDAEYDAISTIIETYMTAIGL